MLKEIPEQVAPGFRLRPKKGTEMLSLLVKFQTKSAAVLSDRRERGATAVEYGLMVALIALAIIVVVGTLGTQLSGLFQKVVNGISGV
jgi:pilus assembly protein Flp/PilA